MGIAAFTRARDELLAADGEGAALDETGEALVRGFASVCSFAASAVMMTDPETNLPTGGVVTGFDPSLCEPFWDNELLDPDFNKFAQLARSTPPMATLSEAVDGELHRSPRYSKLYAAFGAADELRVALTAGTACLAVGVFVRDRADGPFSAAELADVRDLLPVATTVVRRSLGRVEHGTTGRSPTVLILDAANGIRTITAGGRRVLEEIRISGGDEDELPTIVRSAATRARWSRNSSRFATRVQGSSGEWLRIDVSPTDAGDGSVAVTIEQARPSDLVPILLESYGLTARETDVVMQLARGHSTKEIAAELMISAHTVRDHLKSVFEKAEVNGRGELLARLFSRHLLGSFHESVRHVP